MMDWSDRHCRYFWRLLSRRARVYTEMVTTGALIHGDRERFLRFDPAEEPVALQLGGSDPKDLAQCANWAEDWGYSEVNLNCGCPSDRVQNGAFGACLMGEAELVRDCVGAMRERCSLPVTVKHRIGIDNMESYGELHSFVATVAGGGCEVFIVHARKAWLKGLSPKENREIPPLNYPWVYQLKRDFPTLNFVLNGGLESFEDCTQPLEHLDGVMLGRAAYQDPYVLAEVDRRLFGDDVPVPSRLELGHRFVDYVEAQVAAGTPLYSMIRHILGLFQGVRGARAFRRHISVHGPRSGSGAEVLRYALGLIDSEPMKEAV